MLVVDFWSILPPYPVSQLLWGLRAHQVAMKPDWKSENSLGDDEEEVEKSKIHIGSDAPQKYGTAGVYWDNNPEIDGLKWSSGTSSPSSTFWGYGREALEGKKMTLNGTLCHKLVERYQMIFQFLWAGIESWLVQNSCWRVEMIFYTDVRRRIQRNRAYWPLQKSKVSCI